jgi:hypothetical protein
MSWESTVIVAIAIPSWVWFLAALVAIAMPFWVWSLIAGVRHRRFRRDIYSRPDGSGRWRSEFPNDTPVVDRILTIFCDAFLLNERYKYNLVPDDVVTFVYRNTTGPIADEMQMETLAIEVEKAFGVDLTDDWHESTTLRDVVRTVLEKTGQGPQRPGA